MKSLIFFLILFSQVAGAELYKFGNDDVGYLTVLTDATGPAYEPYLMKISVLCKDKRKVKNLVSPVDEEVIPPEYACMVLKPKYDKKSTVVTVVFGKASKEPGEAKCKEGLSQTFNVTELCTSWRR